MVDLVIRLRNETIIMIRMLQYIVIFDNEYIHYRCDSSTLKRSLRTPKDAYFAISKTITESIVSEFAISVKR